MKFEMRAAAMRPAFSVQGDDLRRTRGSEAGKMQFPNSDGGAHPHPAKPVRNIA
jgi:hypothetical protein